MQDQTSTTQETPAKIDFNAFVPTTDTVSPDETTLETEEQEDNPGAQQNDTPTPESGEATSTTETVVEEQVPTPAEATTETTDTAQPQQPSWEEIVKSQKRADVLAQLGDKSEILKELGLSDFVISLHDYYEKGGDVKKYLQANSQDYSAMSDDDVILEGLRLEKPKASEKVLARLYKEEMEKYSFDPDVDDEDSKEYNEFRKSEKADEYRAKLIAAQKEFMLPPTKETPAPEDTSKQEAERQAADQKKQLEESKKQILGNEQTQKLLSEKIIKTSQDFRYEVANPQDLVDLATGEKNFLALFVKEDGSLDMEKWFAVTAFATNRDNYENALINYGKSKAIKATIEEEENPIQRANELAAVTPTLSPIQLLNKHGRESRN